MHDIDTNNTCGCGCGHHHSSAASAYDGPDWKSQPDDALVCYCMGVTKAQVVEAIIKGAYTVPLLKIMTGTVHGQDCKTKHPLKRTCEVDLEELIRRYQTQPPPLEPSGGCGC